MQPMANTFLAILLAHLAGDFPLQTESMIRAKQRGFGGLAIHGLVHYLAVLLSLLIFSSIRVWTAYSQGLLLAYVALHLMLDFLKMRYLKVRGRPDSTAPFVVDQVLHVLTAFVLSLALLKLSPFQLDVGGMWTNPIKHRVLLILVTYSAVIFAGGYLVRSLTRSLTENMPPPPEESREALRNAGLYIGWLERFLVLTALLIQSPAMIGLILTGKSIARLGELKGSQFAEYFLIGTLLSVSLALAGGILLQVMLRGTALP